MRPGRRFDALVCAATGAFAVGMVLMVVGIALIFVSAIERLSFDTLETVLIAGSFGFLGAGAHFLDLIGERKRSEWKQVGNISNE